MKRRILAAAAVAALLSVAWLASADYNVQDHGTHYQNSRSGARTNSTGDARTEDVNFGAWEVFPNILANQLTASSVGLQDSTQVQETWKYKRLFLYLTPQFDSLSTVVRLAVQVRGHYTTATDSGSTFPWYRWPVRNTTVALDVDSVGHFNTGSYTLAQSTAANVLAASGGMWSGEFEVKFNVARQDTVDGTGGLGKFGAYPKTMCLPLADQNGVWFSAPYTSVRVRVLNGVRSRFRLRMDMIGMQ